MTDRLARSLAQQEEYRMRDGDAVSREPGTRLIRVAAGFLEQIGTRTEDGRRIRLEAWGEPDADGAYTPTFVSEDDGWLAAIRSEARQQADCQQGRGREPVEAALAAVQAKADEHQSQAKRTAISSEDWRFTNGYSRALADLRRALASADGDTAVVMPHRHLGDSPGGAE